jgi:hypothetical protein
MLLGQADVVVRGEFTSEVIGESRELGVVHYQGDFRIAQLIKGRELGDRRVGGTIKVNAIRFESAAADRLPELNLGGKFILFLNCNDRQSPPTYTTSDVWLGIQPPSSTMATKLSEIAQQPAAPSVAGLSAEGQRVLNRVRPIEAAIEFLLRAEVATEAYRLDQASVHAYCPPQPTKYDWLVSFPSRSGADPLLVAVTNERESWRLRPESLERWGNDKSALTPQADIAVPRKTVSAQLQGQWRLFLPAGFEYQATLTAEKEDRYRLTPGGLTFGTVFEVQGDHLVSVSDDNAAGGVFKWKIQSPYLLTLVEQPIRSSGDYLGAVFVRLSPAAELRLERE